MGSEYDELLRPMELGPDWWASLKQFPSKIMDQHFGKELFPEDLEEPFKEGYKLTRSKNYIDNTGYSSVRFDDDFFQIRFRSEQFLAKDLKVIFGRNSVTITGMHKLRDEGEGQSFRTFDRRYMLPINVQVGNDQDCCKREGNLLTITLLRIDQDEDTEVDA